MLALQILSAWLLADLLTGIVHWAQDILLNKQSKYAVINKIKADNDLHHSNPGALARESYWSNINTSVPFAWPLALLLYFTGAPFIIWLAIFFASFGNLIHRFAHVHPKRLHWSVRFMQWTGLFISFDHHSKHHANKNGLIKKEDTTIKYCPMTSWLNPIIDWLGLFRLFSSNE